MINRRNQVSELVATVVVQTNTQWIVATDKKKSPPIERIPCSLYRPVNFHFHNSSAGFDRVPFYFSIQTAGRPCGAQSMAD